MTFAESIRSVLTKYVGFEGRACRAEYWYWQLLLVIVLLPLAILAGVLTVAMGPTNVLSMIINGIRVMIQLAVLLPSLAVLVRRLHDVNRSGWWYFIVFTVIGAFVLLYWLIKQGDAGGNKYGDSPLRT